MLNQACEAFKKLLEEQLNRVSNMDPSKTDFTTKKVVTIGVIDGDGIGPIITTQASRVLENPELVTAAQRIAALNEQVTAEVYDLNHFPALRDKYNVMSVPCLVINDGEHITFGKKNIRQLTQLLAK